MKFFETLNTYLKESAENRGKQYQKTLEQIKELESALDDKATLEKQRIEERLEQELETIDPLDLKTKGRIWEEYYDALDELGDRYGRGLQDAVGKIITIVSSKS